MSVGLAVLAAFVTLYAALAVKLGRWSASGLVAFVLVPGEGWALAALSRRDLDDPARCHRPRNLYATAFVMVRATTHGGARKACRVGCAL